MNRDKKILSLLGLARRAGKVVSGEFSVETAIRDGSARLVIVAEDASANTHKLFSDKCSYYHVPRKVFGTKNILGTTLGKEERASVAVKDEGFAANLLKLIDEQEVE